MKYREGIRFICALFMIVLLSQYGISTIRFKNVTDEYQLAGRDFYGGHGASWVDVNGDGLLDLYVKNVGGLIYHIPNLLYINYGTYFINEAKIRGVEDRYGMGTHGAVFADLDNDGDYDLFSTTTYGHSISRNHIYENDGSGYFTDITSGITPKQTDDTESRGVAAADFDADGYIDLYFSNPNNNTDPWNPDPFPPVNYKNFYMNNGNGTFSNEYRGIPWIGFVQGVTAMDFDGDGDIDIAEGKWTPPSTIYLNDGMGNFLDSGATLGLPQTLGVFDGGFTFGDLDNDGDLDMTICGGVGRVAVYKNTGGTFSIFQTVYLPGDGGAHVCLGDFDHDGDLDMYVSGFDVYTNNGNGLFSLVPDSQSHARIPEENVDPRGCALGDFDNDGDLDIYITDKRYFNVFLRNELNDSNWIQVEVSDHMKAIGGFGTKLDLYLAGHVGEAAYRRGHREIHGEYGYLGQDMPIAHFGAPSSEQYDLRITFFDGLQKDITGITSGQRLTVGYPFLYSPLNFSGYRELNKALFYWESIIFLTWESNPQNEEIEHFRLYRVENEVLTLLKELDASTLSYSIRGADRNTTYHFALTEVDIRGRESDPVYLTVE
ncbi:MAG: CRTAC1 family protein [Candidatus Aminicenantes bacterium]|nr:CRTAC1 family protein [Candidatus Aminicenantes bacterium]